MKQFLLSTSVCFALLFSNSHCIAQPSNKKTMELVMEIPKADPVTDYKILKKKLNALHEVKVEGFCNSQKLLMVKLNPEEYFNVLVAVDEAGFSYYIKKDLHIAQVVSACGDINLYSKESSSIE